MMQILFITLSYKCWVKLIQNMDIFDNRLKQPILINLKPSGWVCPFLTQCWVEITVLFNNAHSLNEQSWKLTGGTMRQERMQSLNPDQRWKSGYSPLGSMYWYPA